MDALVVESEHLGRLAVLGTLAATLAHEFNNLATPMASYARLGCAAICDPAPSTADLAFARRALGKCEHAATRAGRLSTAILNMARPCSDDGPAASAAVAQALQDALTSMVRSPAQDSIQLNIDVPPALQVAIEAVRLEQVLLNLLLNARRALMSKPSTDRLLCVTAAPSADGGVELQVSDTGCGIDADQLSTLFEPFSTTSPDGHGLGLNLCRRILDRAGGRIAVQSQAGVGTTFTLTLPKAA